MKNTKFKTYSLDEITDEFIGKKRTPDRDKFEFELKMDLIGEMIRETRKEMNLTQEQLGKLVGVQKAQISKIENNTKDVRLSTIMKVFEALKAKVKFTIEFDKNRDLSIAQKAQLKPNKPVIRHSPDKPTRDLSYSACRPAVTSHFENEKPNYSEAFEELQTIVSEIEEGEITVDELSAKVKRAAQLIKICKVKLISTEEDVNKILKELETSNGDDEDNF